ncbi:hypothetical protein LXL04_011418 [Taraxacum kok-saghyz]
MLEVQTKFNLILKTLLHIELIRPDHLIRISYATKIVPNYSNYESLYLGLFPCISAPKVLSFILNSPVCRSGKENGHDCSSGTTTVASSNFAVEKPQDNNGFHDPVHWVPAPGTPWSYNPWVSMPGYPLITFLPFTILEFHSVVTSGDLSRRDFSRVLKQKEMTRRSIRSTKLLYYYRQILLRSRLRKSKGNIAEEDAASLKAELNSLHQQIINGIGGAPQDQMQLQAIEKELADLKIQLEV